MRISDWSSDVCSSDLAAGLQRLAHDARVVGIEQTTEPGFAVGERGQQQRTYRHALGARQTQLTARGTNRRQIEKRWHRTHRSEEHTSELTSLMRISYSVVCLKNKNSIITEETTQT